MAELYPGVSPLNDEDRWAVLTAILANTQLSFTRALRLVRKAENALVVQSAFDIEHGSRLDWRVLLAEKTVQIHSSGG